MIFWYDVRQAPMADADAISYVELSDSLISSMEDVIAPHFPGMESCAPRRRVPPCEKSVCMKEATR
jgi:hypothetical protein